jgi:FixJ family two-component response regulator
MVFARPHIAVVDDEESVRLALARLLRASSYEVSVFGSAEQFLHSLDKRIPECLVLDFQMAGMTGRDLQRALHDANMTLPVIIMTAHDHPTLREQCLADGAVAYFAKPIRREQLIGAIEAAIKRTAD